MSLRGNDIEGVLQISHDARDGDSEAALPLELGGSRAFPDVRQMFLLA
jgi:hypothetical protein